MKNVLLLGLTALLLFTVSAGLSLWLQQTKTKEEPAADARKAAGKDAERPEPKAKPPHREPPAPAGRDEPPPAGTARELAAIREREDRLEKWKSQVEVILQDIRSEREALDALSRRVTNEIKTAAARAGEAETRAADAERQQRQTAAKTVADQQRQRAEASEDERKNIERMAAMYDSMPAETAAKILQQMADSGRLDTAVRVVAGMKERQAARVLAEIPDTVLTGQILERMRTLNRGPAQPVPGAAKTP